MPERRSRRGRDDENESLFASRTPDPLAARMRPRTLDEVVGQRHLLAPGKPLRDAIEKGSVGPMGFWGPPGRGKTTIARGIAQYTDREVVPLSAAALTPSSPRPPFPL